MKPVITLKNVKHMASQSHETHCFTATVYVDNKKFCTVENDGHGGCDNDDANYDDLHKLMVQLNPNAVKMYDDVDKDANEPWPYPDNWHLTFSMTSQSVFETIVCNLVNDFLRLKDIKNDLRHRFVCVKANSNDNDASIHLYGKKQFGQRDIEQIKCEIERHMEHEVEIINGWDMVDIEAAYELDAAA